MRSSLLVWRQWCRRAREASNSNRLRTFEDARLEIVTYVEAKFGLIIRDSKPSDTGSRGHSDPMDVEAVNSLSRLAKEKGHRVRVMDVLSAVEHIFNETAMHARAQASKRLARANRAIRGPRVRAKERVKKARENPKESPKELQVRSKVPKPKAHTRVNHRKLVNQVLKTRNQRQVQKLMISQIANLMMDGVLTNGMMAGVLMNGKMTGARLDGARLRTNV